MIVEMVAELYLFWGEEKKIYFSPLFTLLNHSGNSFEFIFLMKVNFPNWTFLNFSKHCCGICKPCISTSTYGRKTLGQFYCWQFALHLHLFQALFRNPAASGCCSTITRIPNITSQNNGGKCAVSKNSVCESKYYRGEEGK